jgi:hypothetical protein
MDSKRKSLSELNIEKKKEMLEILDKILVNEQLPWSLMLRNPLLEHKQKQERNTEGLGRTLQ